MNPNGYDIAVTLDTPARKEYAAKVLAKVPVEDREPYRMHLTRKRKTRTLIQNSRLWAMLTDIARQCRFVVDGKPEHLSPEEVKDIMTAALKKHQRMAIGIDGGLVILGLRTSRMTVMEMTELIELLFAYGAEHGVQWSEEARL